MLLSPLVAIVDADVAARAGWTPLDLAAAYLDGGARALQIRAKHLHGGLFLDLCDAVVGLGNRCGAQVIVNDRVDVARLCRAAGVHVGQEDVPPGAAREQLGQNAIIGFSTHTLAQIDAAVTEPVTYIAVGPVFGTGTKDTGYDAVGLERVSAARGRVPAHIPIVAIGGITIDRAAAVRAAGADAVAVISDLLGDGRPGDRVREFLRLLA